jgi:hypothetical protein
MDAAGMIATCGDIRTDNAGTTSSSVRFSPLNTSPSYRCCTGKPSMTSSPPGIASVICTEYGVGRIGWPNGASVSNV